jgi:hypothetical protein
MTASRQLRARLAALAEAQEIEAGIEEGKRARSRDAIARTLLEERAGQRRSFAAELRKIVGNEPGARELAGLMPMGLRFDDADPVAECLVGACRWHGHGDSVNDAVTAWTRHLTKDHRGDWPDE